MGLPLLVIQHEPDKGLGVLEAPLRLAGAELDIRFAGRDPLEIADHVGVIALPGAANPVDATAAVSATRSSLRDALDRELPILGICLGAELLAEAAGGKTFPCRAEFGYWPVSLTDQGAIDPILTGLPARFEAFQAHGYAAELPHEAIALAHSENVLQAFRIGSCVWGVQFHPEPTVDMITSWIRAFGPVMEGHGVNLENLAAQAQRDVPVWSGLGGGIAQRFVQMVGRVRR
jgi:GMP synthase-like glutamine amidotransferase